MSSLTVRNLPADYVEAYKAMAKIHDRSYEAQIRHVLRRVIDDELVRDELEPTALTRNCICDLLKALYLSAGAVGVPIAEYDSLVNQYARWEFPVNGRFWRGIYAMSRDEVGGHPVALKEGGKLFGLRVSFIHHQSLNPPEIARIKAFPPGYAPIEISVNGNQLPFDLGLWTRSQAGSFVDGH